MFCVRWDVLQLLISSQVCGPTFCSCVVGGLDARALVERRLRKSPLSNDFLARSRPTASHRTKDLARTQSRNVSRFCSASCLRTACRYQLSILAEATFRLPGASRPAAGPRRATESSSNLAVAQRLPVSCRRWRNIRAIDIKYICN